MADNPLLNRVGAFASQPVTRQLALLIGMAASVALGVGLVQWASTPDFQPLYGSMSPSDNATALQALETSGITYQVDQGTGVLKVPYAQVAKARIALASEGFPRGGGVGFESLYQEQEMGLSSFMEQARYHRAVEAELARTIASMDSVKGARVHLAIAKQSAFMRRGQEASASVMVSLYPGQTLSQRQLSGVIHLVASSTQNLDAAHVSVVDQAGKLLSEQGRDSDFDYSADQFRMTQQIEQSLNDRVVSILEPILGVGAVRAQITADLDFTRIERTSEVYDPQSVLRSEQTSEDISNDGSSIAAGIPGVLTDQAPGVAVLTPQNPNQVALAEGEAAGQAVPARESRKSTRNYEVNKNISHIQEVPGSLRKLSVAVVVDYMMDPDGNKIALPQERIDEINSLVREAVGFDVDRGDTVSIINSPFIALAPMEAIPEPGLLEQDWIWQAGRALLALIALLVLIFTVLRPLVRYSTSYVAPALAGQNNDALALPNADTDTVALSSPPIAALPGATTGNYHQSIAMARNVANEQPARAAYVVRNWMSADG